MPANNSIYHSKILLHTCCSPCCCSIIELLLSEGVRPDLFFYNPNIHPFDEYLQRKAAVIAYAHKKDLDLIDADYDPEFWLANTKGLENEPERGKRCSICFDIRLRKTAQYAYFHQYKSFATTNGISRWKDMAQVNHSGRQAALAYPGLVFVDRNWRSDNALSKAALICKKELFYIQNYCGCSFSRRNISC